jgi:hypothetical protein
MVVEEIAVAVIMALGAIEFILVTWVVVTAVACLAGLELEMFLVAPTLHH